MSMIHRHKAIQKAKKPSESKPKAKVEETIGEVIEKPKKYTKTDVARLSKSELVELATSIGIESADEYSGAKLKNMIVDAMKL